MRKHLFFVKHLNRIAREFSSSTNDILTTTFQNGVKTITLSDPKTRNCLSIEMMKKLIANIEYDEDLRVVIIRSEGPVFSAGHNLKELSPENGREQQQEVFDLGSKLMMKIINSPVPVIARVDGVAAAAGCQLVAQCDLAFCSDTSSFLTPGANFGIFCSTPGVALARAMPKATALKMLLTGLPISAEEAQNSGLVTKACPVGDLDSEIGKTCDAIKSKSRSVIELGKKFYYKQIAWDVKTAYELGGQKMVENLQMEDGKEGVRSFVEKRKPSGKHTIK